MLILQTITLILKKRWTSDFETVLSNIVMAISMDMVATCCEISAFEEIESAQIYWLFAKKGWP